METYDYQRIKEFLRQTVALNKQTLHFRLPSENQLARQFKTSRISARKAYDDLAAEGIVFRQKGKGTFISPPRGQTCIGNRL